MIVIAQKAFPSNSRATCKVHLKRAKTDHQLAMRKNNNKTLVFKLYPKKRENLSLNVFDFCDSNSFLHTK